MMSRRAVLTGGAGALALAVGGTGLSLNLSASRYRRYAEELRRPPQAHPGTLELVRYATLAANGHNTQPWSFRLSGERIDIRPDFSRRTPVVDPDDHHLYVSLGCAFENLMIAAGAAGRPGTAEPVGGGEGGIGLVLTTGSPPEDSLSAALFEAIPRRQSTRGLYDGRPVPLPELRNLASSVAVEGVDMVLLTGRPELDRMRDLVIAGNSEQMDDPAFRRELRQWIRFSPERAMQAGDGLYAAASGNPALPDWIGSLAFRLAFTKDAENDKYARQMNGSSGVAVFAAASEGPAGWIAVGRACQRFCLMATAHGMKTAFVNQPVEVASLRTDLASLAGIAGRRPDLVIRFGYGPALPYSPRRPAEAVVEA